MSRHDRQQSAPLTSTQESASMPTMPGAFTSAASSTGGSADVSLAEGQSTTQSWSQWLGWQDGKDSRFQVSANTASGPLPDPVSANHTKTSRWPSSWRRSGTGGRSDATSADAGTGKTDTSKGGSLPRETDADAEQGRSRTTSLLRLPSFRRRASTHRPANAPGDTSSSSTPNENGRRRYGRLSSAHSRIILSWRGRRTQLSTPPTTEPETQASEADLSNLIGSIAGAASYYALSAFTRAASAAYSYASGWVPSYVPSWVPSFGCTDAQSADSASAGGQTPSTPATKQDIVPRRSCLKSTAQGPTASKFGSCISSLSRRSRPAARSTALARPGRVTFA